MWNVKQTIKSFLGLPCFVIFTNHEDLIESDEDGTIYYLPKGTGKMKTDIPKWFNETYYAWRNPHKRKARYYWETQGSDKREYLKSSMNQLGALWDNPIEITLTLEGMTSSTLVPQGLLALIEKWEKAHSKKLETIDLSKERSRLVEGKEVIESSTQKEAEARGLAPEDGTSSLVGAMPREVV